MELLKKGHMTLHHRDADLRSLSKLKHPELASPPRDDALGLIHRYSTVMEARPPRQLTIFDNHLETSEGEQPIGNAPHHHHPENHERPRPTLDQAEN